MVRIVLGLRFYREIKYNFCFGGFYYLRREMGLLIGTLVIF